MGSITQTKLGVPIIDSTQIEMPSADIQIHLNRTSYSFYAVDVSCNFTISTNQNQTRVLAFIYPQHWTDLSIISDPHFVISYDGLIVDYETMEMQELTDTYEVDAIKWGYAEGTYFAIFEENITSGFHHNVIIETSFVQSANTDQYIFSYFFGSARSFSGDTHETVTITVDEVVELEGLSFLPEEGLVSQEFEGLNRTIAYFDFLVSEMSGDWITVMATHRIVDTVLPATTGFATIVVVVLVVYAIFSSRLSRRLQRLDPNQSKVI